MSASASHMRASAADAPASPRSRASSAFMRGALVTATVSFSPHMRSWRSSGTHRSKKRYSMTGKWRAATAAVAASHSQAPLSSMNTTASSGADPASASSGTLSSGCASITLLARRGRCHASSNSILRPSRETTFAPYWMSSSSTPIGAFRSSASSSGAIIRWPTVSGGGRLIVSERLGSAPASRLARATATATASEQSLDRPKAANRPASASSMRSPLPNSRSAICTNSSSFSPAATSASA
mmetsp:Transcript_26620/g.68982  ORF Transcript_26620/g.68982 Transcript_26620/m.68982 type:complete len:241 (+) Transcript_26620:610-1332(+)